jgi:hypothetical protein
MEKNSILSLHLAPNLRERMGKKSILSLYLAPNLCEKMEKNPSSHSTWRQIFVRGWKKKFHPLTEYHCRFMLLPLPVVVVVVLFIAFQEQWLA